jgi:hypothetical protein
LKIEFFVQASADNFVNWLRDALGSYNLWAVSFVREKTEYALSFPDLPANPVTEPVKIEMDAVEVESGLFFRPKRISGVISFKLLPIHMERVKVKATCDSLNREALKFFLDLLLRLARDWRNTETAEAISRRFMHKHDFSDALEISTVRMHRDDLVNVIQGFAERFAMQNETIERQHTERSGNAYTIGNPTVGIVSKRGETEPLTPGEPVVVTTSFARRHETLGFQEWIASVTFVLQPQGEKSGLSTIWWYDEFIPRPSHLPGEFVSALYRRLERLGLTAQQHNVTLPGTSQTYDVKALPSTQLHDASQDMKPGPSHTERQNQPVDPPSSKSPDDTSDEPWEQIEDKSWNRLAVQLWWQGLNNQSIANQIKREHNLEELSSKTVRNRISKLRQKYGEDIVPLDTTLRKMNLK